MKLPNILTVSRFALAAVFMVCLSVAFPGAPLAAVFFFGIAALTDALDGHLARKVYGCSVFGKLMDPLADKVLTAAAFIGFVELRIMPAWMVTLILAREMMVTGLRLLAVDKGIVLSASNWGKQKTVWQMVFISAILLKRQPVCDVASALNTTVAGIVAHQSALKGGEALKIPHYAL